MSIVGRLYRGEQQFDFPAIWKRALIGSAVLVLVSLGSLAFRGLNLGIEFEGGTSWEVLAPDTSVAEARDALAGTGAVAGKIQTVGTDSIRVRADIDDAQGTAEVTQALAVLADVGTGEVSVTTVGPSWGDQITNKARNALVWFFIIIAFYIAIRLEWRMSVGALVAVAHDIIISVGLYSLFQFEVTPATVIAFLTIMGYSLYDTIVVYDKVREIGRRLGPTERYTYTEMMNLALNQVLMRSINTSITSVLPVLSMLVVGSFFLGALTLQEFALALLIGIIVGSYSSIFVASALVAQMKEREAHHVALARKVRLRSGRKEGTRMVAADDAALGAIKTRPNTSITSVLPVLSMLVVGSFFLGALTLQEFALALLIGIIVGSYSSIFVASALVAQMKEREAHHVALARKVWLRSGGKEGTRMVAADDAALGAIKTRPTADRVRPAHAPPRPRKKKKKR